MIKLKVGERGTVYFSDDLREAGYSGDLIAVPNACVLVIPKPGAKDQDVAESLQYMAQDFDHRARMKEREKKGQKRETPPSEVSTKYPLEIDGKEYRLILNLDTRRFRLEPIEKPR